MSDTPAGWYYAQNNQPIGPMSLDELIAKLPAVGGVDALVFGPGMTAWTAARTVGVIAERLRSTGAPPPPPRSRRSDEIEYEIFGQEMQFVEVTLDPGEMAIAEGGAMMYMTAGVRMQTVFGDPSQPQQGILGKLMTAGKRVLTGESLFMTTFEAARASSCSGCRATVSRWSMPPAR